MAHRRQRDWSCSTGVESVSMAWKSPTFTKSLIALILRTWQTLRSGAIRERNFNRHLIEIHVGWVLDLDCLEIAVCVSRRVDNTISSRLVWVNERPNAPISVWAIDLFVCSSAGHSEPRHGIETKDDWRTFGASDLSWYDSLYQRKSMQQETHAHNVRNDKHRAHRAQLDLNHWHNRLFCSRHEGFGAWRSMYHRTFAHTSSEMPPRRFSRAQASHHKHWV